MEFKTLSELISTDDLKRFGLPEVSGLSFLDRPLIHIFSKKYQQKEILEDVSEEFAKRLFGLTPLFEPLEKVCYHLSPSLFLYQNDDRSFEFVFDYKYGISFILGYYHKKYQFDPFEIIPGYGEELNKASEEKIISIFEEVFLKIFKIVNVAFNSDFDSIRSRREEVINDRKLAKYLSKNVREVIETLKQPIKLPILEEIDKDRFSLIIAIRALVTLGDMEKGKIERDEDLERVSINYLERYMAIIDYISKKSNQEYSCSFHADGELFDYKELKYMYGVYCVEHPETTSEIRNQVDCADLFRRYLIDARTKIKKDEFVKAIQLRFELFPKGEGKEKGYGAFSRRSVVSEDIKRLLEEKHESLLEDKINFFSATDYLWTLEESQTFGGYRGYIYPNGKVIFEKFYRTTRNGLGPTYNESFISMDLLDFIEIAPKSKTELIDFIRSQKQNYEEFTCHVEGLPERAEVMRVITENPKYRDIKRHYHVPGWQEKAKAIIEQKASEYDFDLIETLLSEISNTPQVGKQYIK